MLDIYGMFQNLKKLKNITSQSTIKKNAIVYLRTTAQSTFFSRKKEETERNALNLKEFKGIWKNLENKFSF